MELRFTERHMLALNIGLGAAVFYFVLLCVNDVVTRFFLNQAPAPVEAPAFVRSTPRINSRAGYEGIVKRDVFNLAPQVESEAPVVAEDLHLKLIGTSYLSTDSPFAVIEDAAGNQVLYQVGDDIPDAGKLVAVELTRAVVDRGGRRVALEMQSDAIPQVPDVAAPASDRHHHPAGKTAPPNMAAVRGFKPFGSHAKIKVDQTGKDSYAVARTDLLRSIGNPATMMVQMHASPNLVDGNVNGFTLGQVAPDSAFADLGIEQGDVLTSINGKPVNNPMMAMSAMSQVQTAASMDFGLLRGGSPMKIHLDIH
jgi:general secretion pathway protein C